MAARPDELRRDLTPLERFLVWSYAHQDMVYHKLDRTFDPEQDMAPNLWTIAAAAQLTGPDLTREQLETGVLYCMTKHPLLRTVLERPPAPANAPAEPVASSKRIPRFRPIPRESWDPASMVHTVERTSADAWQPVVHEQLRLGFPEIERAPAWRVVYVASGSGSSELVVLYSHHLGDGTNSYLLVRDVLAGAMLTKEEAAATERRKPMPTGLELAFGRKGKGPVGKRVRNALLTPILKKALTVESDVLPPGDAGALKSNISKELYVKIDPERTKAIVDVCRSKGVKVNSLLNAAQVFAMAPFLLDDLSAVPKKGRKIDMTFLANLRGRSRDPAISATNEDLGPAIFLGMYEPALKPDMKFWDLVRTVDELVRKQVSPKGVLEASTTGAKVVDILLDKMDRMGGTMGVAASSNMGRYPFEQRQFGDIRLRDVFLAQNFSIMHDRHSCCFFTSLESLCISCIYNITQGTDAYYRAYLGLVKALLDSAPDLGEHYTIGNLLDRVPADSLLRHPRDKENTDTTVPKLVAAVATAGSAEEAGAAPSACASTAPSAGASAAPSASASAAPSTSPVAGGPPDERPPLKRTVSDV